MAIPFEEDENRLMSCAVLVNKGKRNGMQVRDVRITVLLRDFRSVDPLQNIRTTSRLMEMVAKRFKAYFDALESPEEGKATYDTFVRDMIAEVNLAFKDDGLALRRFLLGGWEASVESMARIMGIELEGAVKH